MQKETIELAHGYTAEIAQDMDAENPWKAWDCEPPILVFNSRQLEDYGTELSLDAIVRLIPVRLFGPANRAKIIDAIPGLETEDCHYYLDNPRKAKAEDWLNAIREVIDRNDLGRLSSWSEACEFFEGLETLCGLAGVECYWMQSNGYSQGDSAYVFVAALPYWKTQMGITGKVQGLKASAELWGHWAWGDVYGYSAIYRPDGTEIDGSVWGFYGSDHSESGLIESAMQEVDYDIAYLAKEAKEAENAACRDIETTN